MANSSIRMHLRVVFYSRVVFTFPLSRLYFFHAEKPTILSVFSYLNASPVTKQKPDRYFHSTMFTICLYTFPFSIHHFATTKDTQNNVDVVDEFCIFGKKKLFEIYSRRIATPGEIFFSKDSISHAASSVQNNDRFNCTVRFYVARKRKHTLIFVLKEIYYRCCVRLRVDVDDDRI